jgi:CO dehydrogenase maturation factor
MAFTIAVAGKGGVGKTSFCALLLRWLIENKKTPVLAVDADPNSNLSEALGVTVEGTISDILLSTKELNRIPPSMSQDEYIAFELNSTVLVESDDFDLVTMGGPEGPGCYCFPHNVLKKHLETLSGNYKVAVMDNEAGLEHISRGTTTDDIDVLFVLSDTSMRSVRSAGRVVELTKELKIPVKHTFFVITRGQEGDETILKDEISKAGLSLSGIIPNDPKLIEYEISGKPLFTLPDDSVSVAAANKILNETLGGIL